MHAHRFIIRGLAHTVIGLKGPKIYSWQTVHSGVLVLIVPVWTRRPVNQERPWCIFWSEFQSKAGEDGCLSLRLKTISEILHINGLAPVKIFKSFKIWAFIYLSFFWSGRKKTKPRSLFLSLFLLYGGPQSTRWGVYLPLERAVWFTVPDSVLISPRNTLTARNNV